MRKEIFGKWIFRADLPTLRNDPKTSGEFKFYNLLLTRAFGIEKETSGSFTDLIDIGCRNWSYIRALAEFFPNVNLTGVEVDGYRRYWNLYRRIDLAQAHAQSERTKGRFAQVITEDFLNFNLPSSSGKGIFCFFYPYVSENPCLKAGLPVTFVNFHALLQHAKNLGLVNFKEYKIISAHQGEWEAEEARKLYESMQITFRETKIKPEEFRAFWPSPYETVVFLSR